MSRIPLTDPATLTGERRAQYDRFPSNLTRTLLLLDDRLARALPETANALRDSSLDPAWREAVILRVAATQHSAYERMQHLGQAGKLGWTGAQIQAIEGGDLAAVPAGLASVLRYADGVVANDVSDDVFAAARTAAGDRGVVTVIALVGHYMTVARLTGVLEVDLDDKPDTWTHEH